MPVEFYWYDEAKTILVQRYYDSVSIADYREAVNENTHWLSQVAHPVDLILDALDARINWGGLISAANYADVRVPHNQRLIILVTTHRFVRTMIDIARRVAPRANQNQHFAVSLPQALEMIHSLRGELSLKESTPSS